MVNGYLLTIISVSALNWFFSEFIELPDEFDYTSSSSSSISSNPSFKIVLLLAAWQNIPSSSSMVSSNTSSSSSPSSFSKSEFNCCYFYSIIFHFSVDISWNLCSLFESASYSFSSFFLFTGLVEIASVSEDSENV
jgi:hypothetical protein